MPYAGRQRYCFECTVKANSERNEQRKRSRDYKTEYKKRLEREDPKIKRFYHSKEWRMTSLQYQVDAKHMCEMQKGAKCEKTGGEPCDKCKGLGTDVHHKQPIQTQEGWNRRLDPTNLELLCVCCHNCRHPEKDFHKKRTDEEA